MSQGAAEAHGLSTDALFSRLSRPGEHLAPQRWLGSVYLVITQECAYLDTNHRKYLVITQCERRQHDNKTYTACNYTYSRF